MPYADFREFLTALRAAGELIDVDRPVALEPVIPSRADLIRAEARDLYGSGMIK